MPKAAQRERLLQAQLGLLTSLRCHLQRWVVPCCRMRLAMTHRDGLRCHGCAQLAGRWRRESCVWRCQHSFALSLRAASRSQLSFAVPAHLACFLCLCCYPRIGILKTSAVFMFEFASEDQLFFSLPLRHSYTAALVESEPSPSLKSASSVAGGRMMNNKDCPRQGQARAVADAMLCTVA